MVVKICSHRGFHKKDGIQENTIPAFEEAVDLGIEMIELDVHRTLDDVWIVHHDSSIKRNLDIATSTYEAIKSYSEDFDYRIDTLKAVLEKFNKIEFNIECKRKSFEDGKLLGEFLESNNHFKRNIVSSFSVDTLKGIRKVSEIRTSLLGVTFLLKPWKKLHSEIGLFSLHPFYSFCSKPFVNRIHKQNIEVHVWTVNREKVMRRMIKRDVDVIITDKPDIALSLIK